MPDWPARPALLGLGKVLRQTRDVQELCMYVCV